MSPKKKVETPPAVSNINNNTNNVHVDVKLEHPKPLPPKKPNWIVKAMVVGAIGLALSLLGYFIKKHFDGDHGKPAVIENGVAPISGTKVK